MLRDLEPTVAEVRYAIIYDFDVCPILGRPYEVGGFEIAVNDSQVVN